MKTSPTWSKRCVLAAVALIVAGPCFATGAPASRLAGELTIGGTGAALGTMRHLADGFRQLHPDIRIRIVPGLGSSGGIKAVLAGQLSLGVSGRPLTEAEAAKGIAAMKFARTPFVFATGAKTVANDVSLDDLASIYSGKRTAWPDGAQVRPVLRPPTDIDTQLVTEMTPQLADAMQAAHQRDGRNIATTDTDMADQLERIPGTVGTSTLALIVSEDRRLKALSIAGVQPTLANIASGKYPYEKSQFLVIGTSPDPLVQEFVRYVDSPAGAAVLRSSGNMPTGSSQRTK